MNTHIKVTYGDLAKGTKSNSGDCPIARAVARATGRELGQIKIGTSEAFVGHRDTDDYAAIPLPEPARQLVRDFDADRPTPPIEFELNLQPLLDKLDKKGVFLSCLINPDKPKEAAEVLERVAEDIFYNSLDWVNTEEGYDFWMEVHSNLEKYASKARESARHLEGVPA